MSIRRPTAAITDAVLLACCWLTDWQLRYLQYQRPSTHTKRPTYNPRGMWYLGPNQGVWIWYSGSIRTHTQLARLYHRSQGRWLCMGTAFQLVQLKLILRLVICYREGSSTIVWVSDVRGNTSLSHHYPQSGDSDVQCVFRSDASIHRCWVA